jgi:hypothetical protein
MLYTFCCSLENVSWVELLQGTFSAFNLDYHSMNATYTAVIVDIHCFFALMVQIFLMSCRLLGYHRLALTTGDM